MFPLHHPAAARQSGPTVRDAGHAMGSGRFHHHLLCLQRGPRPDNRGAGDLRLSRWPDGGTSRARYRCHADSAARTGIARSGAGAAAAHRGYPAMSIPLRRWRTTRLAAAGGGLLLLAWTLIPVYNMLLIALSNDGDEFTGAIWPDEMNLDSFRLIWTEGHWYLEHFWRQFGNSLLVGVATMLLTVLIGSLASFAMGRMRSRHAWTVGPIALLTYAVPASFLVIPFTRVTHAYGLVDSPWAVIAAHTTFVTPFAILVFHQYGKL